MHYDALYPYRDDYADGSRYEFYDDHGRYLAEEDYYYKKEEEPLDYSVLSVGVMTLGLLLLVEMIRHQLDHRAEGRPFFKTVLEMVYSECKLTYDITR